MAMVQREQQVLAAIRLHDADRWDPPGSIRYYDSPKDVGRCTICGERGLHGHFLGPGDVQVPGRPQRSLRRPPAANPVQKLGSWDPNLKAYRVDPPPEQKVEKDPCEICGGLEVLGVRVVDGEKLRLCRRCREELAPPNPLTEARQQQLKRTLLGLKIVAWVSGAVIFILIVTGVFL